MENYPSYSYPDSGDSSPRSREIDFENPPPSWDEQQLLPPTHKVKFMVSYGGKIQPRSHDNLLSYVGGDTKILSVDRNIKFSSFYSKLSSLVYPDFNDSVFSFTFKYQLPGEELDALISVTNDDDLEHLMHEYERLYRGPSKPARLRLFLFPVQKSGFGSTSSDPGKVDSAPVDFLFGLEKGPDPQNRAQIPPPAAAQEMNRPKSEDGFTGGFDGYPKGHPPVAVPASVQIPGGYWQQQQQQPPPPAAMNIEQQVQHPPPQNQQYQQPHHQQQQQQQQPVYMMHAPAPAGMYHAPMVRPVTQQPNQGYYQVTRVPSEQQVYREQPVYNMAPPPQQTVQGKVGGYSEGMGLQMRQVAGMAGEGGGYAQVAYDSATGRQVYYAAPGPAGAGVGVVTAPFQGLAVSGEMRTSAEGKMVQKIMPTSPAV